MTSQWRREQQTDVTDTPTSVSNQYYKNQVVQAYGTSHTPVPRKSEFHQKFFKWQTNIGPIVTPEFNILCKPKSPDKRQELECRALADYCCTGSGPEAETSKVALLCIRTMYVQGTCINRRYTHWLQPGQQPLFNPPLTWGPRQENRRQDKTSNRMKRNIKSLSNERWNQLHQNPTLIHK